MHMWPLLWLHEINNLSTLIKELVSAISLPSPLNYLIVLYFGYLFHSQIKQLYQVGHRIIRHIVCCLISSYSCAAMESFFDVCLKCASILQRCYEHKQYRNGLKFCKQILTNPKFAEHGGETQDFWPAPWQMGGNGDKIVWYSSCWYLFNLEVFVTAC